MQWDTKMKMSKNFDCHCNYGLVGKFGQLTTCSEAGNPTSIPQQGFLTCEDRGMFRSTMHYYSLQ